jgi:hypothetical protein
MIVETVEREGRLQKIMKSSENVYLGVSIPFLNMEVWKESENRFIFSLQAIVKLAVKSNNKSREVIKLLLSMIYPSEIVSPTNSFTKSPPLELNFEQSFSIRKKSASDHKYRGQMTVSLHPSINEAESKMERNDSSDNEEE